MDLNDEGRLRNVFCVDARSRVANAYFGDVIFLDTTYLSNKYEAPLVSFVSVNNHGQSIILGCGLLSNETVHSYIWLFKVWLSIITGQCKVLQSAVADVFPKSQHRFCLSHIMRKVPEKLGGLPCYDAIRKALLKGVYETLKSFDFEAAWWYMIQRFGVADNEWLRSLYEDRALWAPVYLKETFFMGMSATKPGGR